MYGRRVHATVLLFRRITEGDMWSEVIAQRVHKEYDQGVVVKSKKVSILPTDTVDELQQRALPIEHRVQIEMLKDLATGDIQEVLTREIIVHSGQEEILETAKKVAGLLYPKG